jgi:hypothetical protein
VNVTLTNPNDPFIIGGDHFPEKSDSDVKTIKMEMGLKNQK